LLLKTGTHENAMDFFATFLEVWRARSIVFELKIFPIFFGEFFFPFQRKSLADFGASWGQQKTAH